MGPEARDMIFVSFCIYKQFSYCICIRHGQFHFRFLINFEAELDRKLSWHFLSSNHLKNLESGRITWVSDLGNKILRLKTKKNLFIFKCPRGRI